MYVVERIRIENFRQLKREIRGSADHLIVGIDVGKENHHSFFGTSTGKTLLESCDRKVVSIPCCNSRFSL